MDDASSRAEAGFSRSIEAARLEALARDWLTLWQSELTAMAADREVRETWTGLIGLWAGAASAMIAAMPKPPGPRPAGPRGARDQQPAPAAAGAAPGPAAAEQPPRPAPAAAASEPGDAAIERLHRRIAELEARLATLERTDPAGEPARRPGNAGRRKPAGAKRPRG